MLSVNQIADQIIAREGGFVDDPDDPGGATKHGVTIGTMARLGLDLNGDGQVTKADVHRVTPAIARQLYVREYFQKPGIDTLPQRLQATVFDMNVNAGAASVRLLQRLVGAFGFPTAIDGAIGPKTVKATKQATRIAPDHIVDAYGIERRNFYYRLADSRPASRKFAMTRDGGKGGWILRAEEFISPSYHLSDAEHAARVSSWG